MKKISLFLFLYALTISASARVSSIEAGDVDSEAVPVAPTITHYATLSTDGSVAQYFYNVEAKAFMVGANDWGTRASVSAENGYPVMFNANGDGTYSFTDQLPNGNWNELDCQAVDQIWVDGTGRAGAANWTVSIAEDGSFTIANNNVADGGNLALVPSKGDTRLYLSTEEGAQDKWVAVDEETYNAYVAAYAEYLVELEEYNRTHYSVGDDIIVLAPAAWDGQTGTYGGLNHGVYERYSSTGSIEAGDVLTQTISGLKNGTYEVTLELAASYTSGRGFECPTGDNLSVAFANETSQNLTVVDQTWVSSIDPITLTAVVSDGTLTYGIRNLEAAGNWYVANVTSIKYVSEDEQGTQTLFVSATETEYGTEWNLLFSLQSVKSYSAFQFDITIPDAVSLDTERITNGSMLTGTHSFDIYQSSSNTYQVICYSSSSENFNNTSGTLFSIPLRGTLQGSENQSVQVSNIYFSNNVGVETYINNNSGIIAYPINLYVDGNWYTSEFHSQGTVLSTPADAVKEGHTFQYWDGIPSVMPESSVSAYAHFSINNYTLTYLVDDSLYYQESLQYASVITPIANPTREGYNFSGWQNMPLTMPACDTTIVGYFNINPKEYVPTTGSYTFPDWTSTNYNIDNSESRDTVYFRTIKYSKLTFDYRVSSEQNYDKLSVYLVKVGGSTSTLVSELSGTRSGSYTHTFTSDEAGQYELRFLYHKDGSASSGEDHGYVTNIKIQHPRLGDVNNDGAITSSDVVSEFNRVLNISNAGDFLEEYADMNVDGTISIVDVVRVCNLALTENPGLVKRKNIEKPNADVYVSEFIPEQKSDIEIPVVLEVNGGEYSALQFDMQLPEGCDVKSVKLPTELASMGARIGKTSDGKTRVIIYGDARHQFSCGSNTVSLSVKTAAETADAQKMSLSNIIVATSDGQDKAVDDMETEFVYGSATSINCPTSSTSEDNAPMYNVLGQKVTTPAANRIIIRNGKKYLTK